MDNKRLLEDVYNNFCDKTGYNIVVGAEQEFYLDKLATGNIPLAEYTPAATLGRSLNNYPFFYGPEEENGNGQFEIQIAPTDNPVTMADTIAMLREIIKHTDDSAVFTAKPYSNQPGNGLHIHVNLANKEGRNVFSRSGDDEAVELEQAVAGLLELMPASMRYFAPYEAAYARYIDHGMEAPSTISWGADNRTASLRIPSVPISPHQRRIEHRVPCADADPYLVMCAIIAGIEYGITNKLENKHPKIWGNAFLPQYDLPKLPKTFAEASKIRHNYLDVVMESSGS